MTIQKRNIGKSKKYTKEIWIDKKRKKLLKDKILEKCDDGSSLSILKKKKNKYHNEYVEGEHLMWL